MAVVKFASATNALAPAARVEADTPVASRRDKCTPIPEGDSSASSSGVETRSQPHGPARNAHNREAHAFATIGLEGPAATTTARTA
jgi:hypothetical protein